jgi:hypothetical protein
MTFEQRLEMFSNKLSPFNLGEEAASDEAASDEAAGEAAASQ